MEELAYKIFGYTEERTDRVIPVYSTKTLFEAGIIAFYVIIF